MPAQHLARAEPANPHADAHRHWRRQDLRRQQCRRQMARPAWRLRPMGDKGLAATRASGRGHGCTPLSRRRAGTPWRRTERRRYGRKEVFHLVQFIDKPDRFNPDLVTPARSRKGQTRPNRPWRHAFDPRGLPASTGSDVAEALRHLWYINGQTFGVEFELAARHVDPHQVSDNEWFRRARGLLDHLRRKLDRSKIVANSAVRRDYHYGGYKRWKVEYDSSAGWEVISPVLEGIDGLKELATACDALTDAAEDLDLYPDHRTGTHVHLGWRVKPNHVVRAIQLTHLLEPILRTLGDCTLVLVRHHGASLADDRLIR